MALLPTDPDAPEFVRRYMNLADPRFGAKAISCSDDFFGAVERMLNAEPPVFIPGKYDDHGKWMDGWESRRKRVGGHDQAVIRLARRGVIRGVDLDTTHFTGNFPPAASLEACDVEGDPDGSTRWAAILPSVDLAGNRHHYHAIASEQPWTHVRVHIYPDGGIARLRIHGHPVRDWSRASRSERFELAGAENGGYVVAANNQHFGLASSLLLPGRGANMGDGWETRRRREPGNDWCIIALGHAGTIERIEVDTCHFKGNYPDRCSIQAALVTGGTETSIVTQSMFWPVLLPEQKLQMDLQHFFEKEIAALGPVTHVRFNMHPDGGTSRLRLWAKLA